MVIVSCSFTNIIQIILFCFQQKNKAPTGLEQHEGK